MLKYIFLFILALALIGGYIVYNYVSEKKAQLLKVEKKPEDSSKKLPTEQPNSENQVTTAPEPQTTAPKIPNTTNTPPTANDLKIIDVLTLIANAQYKYESQTGRFASSIKPLAKNNINLKKITDVINSNTDLNEYVYKELLNDKDSEDTRSHFGVIATPMNQTGKSFLLLMDLDKIGAFDSNGQESDGTEFYESNFQGIQLKTWPLPTDLLKWKRIIMKSGKVTKPAPKVFEYNNSDED